MNVKIVFADILSAAWKSYKSQCWLLTGLIIGFTIIFSLLLLFATPTKGEPMSISGIIVYVICFFLFCLFSMGYLRNCLQTLDNEEPQFSAFGQTSRKIFSFIAACLAFSVMIFVGCVLLLFPGIYLALRFQFFYTSMVDEDTGVIESFKRSWHMTKGQTRRLFILMLFHLLIVIFGLAALGIGIFIATPLFLLMYGHAYRKLTAPDIC